MKRYNPQIANMGYETAVMRESSTGDWVRWEDAEKEIRRATAPVANVTLSDDAEYFKKLADSRQTTIDIQLKRHQEFQLLYDEVKEEADRRTRELGLSAKFQIDLLEELNEYRQGYQHLQQKAEIARLRKALKKIAKEPAADGYSCMMWAKAALEGE
jgi:hypothetical protein